MKRLSILLVAMLLIASAAQAEALEPAATPVAELTEALETTIRATGTESVSLPADIVVLTLCVQGSGDNVTAAQDRAEQVMQNLRAALAQMGISEHDAQTAYYGVETVYNYQYSKLGEKETASGYTVSIDLSVRLDDPARVGEVIGHPVKAGERTYAFTLVNMGNPHAVCFVEDPDTAPVTTEGPVVEHHADFPERINVEFVKVENRGHLRMRVWERGTGETLACGTGACAAAVAACLNGLCGRSVAVTLPGGTLQIEWSEDDGHVYLTGPATFVYDGVWLQK